MIKIIEDGMEFVMEHTDGDRCSACVCSGYTNNSCEVKIPEVYSVCQATWRHGRNKGSICTSATTVQEETKVYHAANRDEATHLIGDYVEIWVDDDWHRTKLDDIGSEGDNCFYVNNSALACRLIREAKPRRLTQAQIIEAHPDLDGVELVGGWSNG